MNDITKHSKIKEVLSFIWQRLVYVHKENSNYDYMINFDLARNEISDLIDLAQKIKDCKGMPERKEILGAKEEVFTADDMNNACNEVLEDCTIAFVKLEELYHLSCKSEIRLQEKIEANIEWIRLTENKTIEQMRQITQLTQDLEATKEILSQEIMKYTIDMEAKDEEIKAVREYLWLTHGHQGIYGDDGEMQCSLCKPFDYKRADLLEVVKGAVKSIRENTQLNT